MPRLLLFAVSGDVQAQSQHTTFSLISCSSWFMACAASLAAYACPCQCHKRAFATITRVRCGLELPCPCFVPCSVLRHTLKCTNLPSQHSYVLLLPPRDSYKLRWLTNMLSTKRPASDERSPVQTSCALPVLVRLPAYWSHARRTNALGRRASGTYHQFMTPNERCIIPADGHQVGSPLRKIQSADRADMHVCHMFKSFVLQHGFRTLCCVVRGSVDEVVVPFLCDMAPTIAVIRTQAYV
jgi:hypothetical protein